MSEDVNTNANENKEEVANIPQQQEVDYDALRLMPVNMIEEMLAQIYNNNRRTFDLYFNLIKVRDNNKIAPPPAEEMPDNGADLKVVKNDKP